jgi:hypothetical protein
VILQGKFDNATRRESKDVVIRLIEAPEPNWTWQLNIRRSVKAAFGAETLRPSSGTLIKYQLLKQLEGLMSGAHIKILYANLLAIITPSDTWIGR